MIDQMRAYLAKHYPSSVEGENHKLDDDGRIVAWGFAEFGEPPSVEAVLGQKVANPRTTALSPAEITAAREAIQQATEQAQRSTSAVLRDAVILLAATFDGVLSKLGGHDDVLKEDHR